MKIKQFSKSVTAIISSAILFAGCATKIPVTTMRPAELDIKGAKTMAILPVQTTNAAEVDYEHGTAIILELLDILAGVDSTEEEACANYLTETLENGLANSNYISVVNSQSVKNALKNGIQNPADVYCAGRFTDFNSSVVPIEKQTSVDSGRKDSQGRTIYKTVYEKCYKITVDFKFRYEIIESSTGKILGSNSYNYSTSSGEYSTKRSLPSALEICESKFNSISSDILHKLQPYQITYTLNLLTDKSDVLKEANKIAKKGNLETASTMYDSYYETTGSFESRYNYILLQQAVGNLLEARDMMKELYIKTGDLRAEDALSSINYELKQNSIFAEQVGN